MNKETLFGGSGFLALMALFTFLTENSFVGARPYAACATVLMVIALAIKK